MPDDRSPALTTVFVDQRATARRMRKSRLAVIEGPDKGKSVEFVRERATVGRSSVNDLVVSDKAISGCHFEIATTEGGHILRDLGSTNGTYYQDCRIREIFLKPGVVVRAGTSRFQFQTLDASVQIPLSENERFGDLVGASVPMREIFATLERVASSELTVLVSGETGTGKELVARAIHQYSRRAEKPYVTQDCSAIPRDLIESTLFGHEKGSFTGAVGQHRGCFEQAHGGTIFLDEIGELDLSLQPKLLRVLENREIKRVGGDRSVEVDVRAVAATNRDLRAMINQGTFREDLYFRLSVIHVDVPPLRDRRDDIPVLVRSFLDVLTERWYPGEGRRYEVTDEAMARLCSHQWPGNVRELRNTVERAASLADGTLLGPADFRVHARPTTAAAPTSAVAHLPHGLSFKDSKQQVVDQFEVAYLSALLEKHKGNITRSAQEAGLTRYHLRELLKRHGIVYQQGG
jgi:transcriptional regulator with GAF, ATPase, and Fis domain